MLDWAVVFLIGTIIARLFGFFGVADLVTGIGKILSVIFLIFFGISLIIGYRGNLMAIRFERKALKYR